MIKSHAIAVALLLLVAAAPSVAAENAAAASDTPRADFRKQLLSEFKFVARAGDPEKPEPFLAEKVEIQPVDAHPERSDVIEMAPFTVKETVKFNKLHADFLEQKADARTAATMTKLGVGVHTLPMGFYVATIFYIPFNIGFGFPWRPWRESYHQ